MDANTHSSGASNGRTLEDVVNHLHANHETKNECSTDPMDSKEETNDAINDGIDGNASTHTNGANASQSTSDLNGDQNVTTNEDNNHNENNANENGLNAESNGSTNDSNDSNDKFLAFDDDDEEDNLLSYDPTPDTSYPSVKWHSLQQLQQREYGKLMRPGNSRPINSYESQAFRRYAYNSLYFFQRLELMSKFEEHTGCVNCLNFNNCGDRLISGSDDLRVAVWDWQKSHLIHKYHTGHSSNVFQCRWCADQHHIVSCARDGQVRICNVHRNGSTVSNKLAQHKGAVHKLTLTAPQVILSCGEDSVVFEIDLRNNKPTKLLSVK
ncbi:unnamed protein product [Medioppia subpectinata]|uniref:Uncharacterized protein n=1 Tax=Medioppia subpectinata TaxID=1979941 RepID=A0A7R9LEQ0_9ACAR|nr:unnamed protein product [Medioppia subpectinata]CAG2118206.1 unnamed protein product [Medioppia subpectinata]